MDDGSRDEFRGEPTDAPAELEERVEDRAPAAASEKVDDEEEYDLYDQVAEALRRYEVGRDVTSNMIRKVLSLPANLRSVVGNVLRAAERAGLVKEHKKVPSRHNPEYDVIAWTVLKHGTIAPEFRKRPPKSDATTELAPSTVPSIEEMTEEVAPAEAKVSKTGKRARKLTAMRVRREIAAGTVKDRVTTAEMCERLDRPRNCGGVSGELSRLMRNEILKVVGDAPAFGDGGGRPSYIYEIQTTDFDVEKGARWETDSEREAITSEGAPKPTTTTGKEVPLSSAEIMERAGEIWRSAGKRLVAENVVLTAKVTELQAALDAERAKPPVLALADATLDQCFTRIREISADGKVAA